jgi:uncharacterized protein YdaU (DUF1376 family)
MAADTLPMMPFFVRDFIAATRGMTLEQRGAYVDLLFFQWDLGELPSDPVELSRMLGASVEQFTSIWPVIASKFKESNGTLKNLRVEIERKKAKKLKKTNSTKAKTAAKARWNKDKTSVAKPMLGALLEDCPPSPSPSSSDSDQDSLRAEAIPIGSIKTQIYRLAKQLEIAPGVLTTELKTHSETEVWQALGATIAAKPAEALPYFRACLKAQKPDDKAKQQRMQMP